MIGDARDIVVQHEDELLERQSSAREAMLAVAVQMNMGQRYAF
jgi:hypothetical protein